MVPIDHEVAFNKDDLDLLYKVSSSIHSIRDMEKMLRNILLKIRDVFSVEGASIALHDRIHKEFFFLRTAEEQRGVELPGLEDMKFSDDYGVAGWVLRHQEPVLIQDVSKDERFIGLLDIQKNFETRSMICVPLKTREGVIGVLYVLNKKHSDFIPKDLRLLEILSSSIAISIENARLIGEIKQYATSLEKENFRLKKECQARFNIQGIIGSSAAMQRVYALMEKVIDNHITVLIQGETGTGKELLAKVIHFSGPTKNKPFIAENCGGLSENLLESELFGHVKGSFTGAVSDKKGLFELAGGGTVFLDEIANMPFSMQTKLLRVLQENMIRPVGGSEYKQLNFRLICSTNRDLLGEVKRGNFRDDLFYRIQVFPIVLPPLRDRKEDIPFLADHFLKEFALKLKRPQARLTPRALETFVNYDWPGNVRELKNEIERALTLAGNCSEIKQEYFSERIYKSAGYDINDEKFPATLKEATERMERKMVMDAIHRANGNRSKAARILGLTRQGLLNKIKRYEI